LRQIHASGLLTKNRRATCATQEPCRIIAVDHETGNDHPQDTHDDVSSIKKTDSDSTPLRSTGERDECDGPVSNQGHRIWPAFFLSPVHIRVDTVIAVKPSDAVLF
jgi:hypothetical protein